MATFTVNGQTVTTEKKQKLLRFLDVLFQRTVGSILGQFLLRGGYQFLQSGFLVLCCGQRNCNIGVAFRGNERTVNTALLRTGNFGCIEPIGVSPICQRSLQ